MANNLERAIANINGLIMTRRLNELATFSECGKIGEGGSRLGLSHAEHAARGYLSDWMHEAGFDRVVHHPMGLVARYNGSDNRFSPVAFGSHFDTVPAAGKYDGPAGTIAAISVVESFRNEGIRTPRPFDVYAFTLEESSRFNAALLGSRAMTHGLTNEQLALADSDGTTLSQAVDAFGFDPVTLRESAFKRNPRAFIEMHIEQAATLADSRRDIGAVEAIAATDREKIFIGEGPVRKVSLRSHTEGIAATFNGTAGHSGGTPMGEEHRADGLVATSYFLDKAISHNRNLPEVDLHIVNVDISGQALNKIPGETTTTLLVSGDDPQRVADARRQLGLMLDTTQRNFESRYSKFGENALDIRPLNSDEITSAQFLDPGIVNRFHATAALAVLAVEDTATRYRASRTVGTVGTYVQLPDGSLELGVDFRGVDRDARTRAFNQANNRITEYGLENNVPVEFKELPSIKNPSIMNPELTDLVASSADRLGLSWVRMMSGPGHDAQNFVDRGVPTATIFIPSRNGGLSHNPREYSTPHDLENGARVLAAVVANLASR